MWKRWSIAVLASFLPARAAFGQPAAAPPPGAGGPEAVVPVVRPATTRATPQAAPATTPATMQAAKPAAQAGAASRITAVTVYQGNALVTREVDVREGTGVLEVIVTPLPPQAVDSSLYSEGTDGIRVLSTRYRARAVQADTRAEVREKEQEIRKLQEDLQKLQKDVQVGEENLHFLTKLENFTTATMSQLQEKGMLNPQATLELTKFVLEQRSQRSNQQVMVQQQIQKTGEDVQFAQRQLNELTAGSSRTESDAVIVVDKTAPGAGKLRLNYLVTSANWAPQYKLRAAAAAGGGAAGAAAAEKEAVQLEYLAAIEQQSGEDWNNVAVVLSTAQPMLNAAPPELLALDIQVGGRHGGGGGGGGGGPTTQPLFGRGNFEYSQDLRNRAQVEFNGNNTAVARGFINDAAALEQTQQLLSVKEDPKGDDDARAGTQGPSVTYHLKPRFTVPSRNDQQLIEVAHLEMAPDYFYKAVPVLTPLVYRLALLTNKSDDVLLPGEATMYVGSDFVGRMNLPLVAIGEQFTAGFGVDPQLQVDRKLVSRSGSVQGGNQVHAFDYRIRVSSFKTTPASIQVWDRLPRAEAEAVGINLAETKPLLSADARYLRAERPQNLLRWDLVVQPGMNGEKAATIQYQFKLEYDKNVAVGNFKAAK